MSEDVLADAELIMAKMERDGWRLTPFRALAAEVRALRADVVWCVENPYRILGSSGMWDDMPGDAPDADILRAVREAREG